ncbi:glycosyltransferase [uncultured Ilyobacter sp.]|uniref:glycosyltransferase n=1 Tax=uncultured Ilyobacter sp. TaxID=544433 RepID=UPI0029C7E490|nr:glycosyltransferase [uncultured Ilyobacter sp.]
MKNPAPIALFVYNRPEETAGLLKSLKRNKLAEVSSLFIFSDAPKSSEQRENVNKTRTIINHTSGFKNIEIFESTENKGLARSIIEGVTQIIDKYGKIIVLEDDLILSGNFLEYMNGALNLYENNKSIWTVTGYGPPIEIDKSYQHDIYLSYRGCSWGWGTWKNRWEKHDWNLSDYEDFIAHPDSVKAFQKGGNDLLKMLELQALGKLDSWAIRSCYSQFKQGMYTIYPVNSKLQNIGFGINSTHCTSSGSKYKTDLYENKVVLSENLELNNKILYEFKKYYDLDFIGKIGYFLKKHNLYKYFKWTKSYLRK